MVSMVIVPLTRITAYRNVSRNCREIGEPLIEHLE